MEREETLVQRAVGGDREAYGALVERYKDLVYGLALSYVGDFWAAQDVTQEALIRGWEKLSELVDPAKFSPWLRTLTVNLCRMWLRGRRTEMVPIEEVDEGEILPTVNRPRLPSELYDEMETRDQVMAAIGRGSSVFSVSLWCMLRGIGEWDYIPTCRRMAVLCQDRIRVLREPPSGVEPCPGFLVFGLCEGDRRRPEEQRGVLPV